MAQKNKVVVDHGAYFSFPPPAPYVELPAGHYTPGWTNSSGFILRKNEKASETKLKLEDLKARFYYGRDNDSSQSQDASKTEAAEPDINKEVFNEIYNPTEYFPMEKYNPGLELVEESIGNFINNREYFVKNNLDYKRSILLFSTPGTGKTWFIKNLTQNLVHTQDAIVIQVIRGSHLNYLHDGFPELDRTVRGRLKVIVIEELAEFCYDPELKTAALQLLDNPFFRENALFLVTTNEPNVIPQNLIDRPSRLDVIAHINPFENREGFIPAWYKHLTGKTLSEDIQKECWFLEAKKTLTPVYWSELFKFADLHGIGLAESWEQIKQRKKLIKNAFSEEEDRKVGF